MGRRTGERVGGHRLAGMHGAHDAQGGRSRGDHGRRRGRGLPGSVHTTSCERGGAMEGRSRPEGGRRPPAPGHPGVVRTGLPGWPQPPPARRAPSAPRRPFPATRARWSGEHRPDAARSALQGSAPSRGILPRDGEARHRCRACRGGAQLVPGRCEAGIRVKGVEVGSPHGGPTSFSSCGAAPANGPARPMARRARGHRRASASLPRRINSGCRHAPAAGRARPEPSHRILTFDMTRPHPARTPPR